MSCVTVMVTGLYNKRCILSQNWRV